MSLNDIKKYLVHYEDKNDLKHMLKLQKGMLFKKEMEIKTSIAVIDAILSTIDIHELYDLEEMIKVTINLNKDSIFTYANIDFDPETTSVFQDRFTDDGEVVEVYWRWKRLVLEAFCLIKNHIKPESKAGYRLGEKWDAFISLVTDDRPELIDAYAKAYSKSHLWPLEDKFLMDHCADLIEKAYQYYLSKKDD